VGFTGEYVDNLSPAERELYNSYYIMDSKESVDTDSNRDAVRDLGLEFGDLV